MGLRDGEKRWADVIMREAQAMTRLEGADSTSALCATLAVLYARQAGMPKAEFLLNLERAWDDMEARRMLPKKN